MAPRRAVQVVSCSARVVPLLAFKFGYSINEGLAQHVGFVRMVDAVVDIFFRKSFALNFQRSSKTIDLTPQFGVLGRCTIR